MGPQGIRMLSHSGGTASVPPGSECLDVDIPGIVLRGARSDELESLCDIDMDASRLFDAAGLELASANALEFAAAERNRWLDCLRSGTTLIASSTAEGALGFAALRILDGEQYLEQLSLRRGAMRRGIGTALLRAAERTASRTPARALWLTTYRHLAWNAPFYERVGFVIVSPEQCGRELQQELALQRRLLPLPQERVAMRKALRMPAERTTQLIRAEVGPR